MNNSTKFAKPKHPSQEYRHNNTRFPVVAFAT